MAWAVSSLAISLQSGLETILEGEMRKIYRTIIAHLNCSTGLRMANSNRTTIDSILGFTNYPCTSCEWLCTYCPCDLLLCACICWFLWDVAMALGVLALFTQWKGFQSATWEHWFLLSGNMEINCKHLLFIMAGWLE